MRNFVVTFFLFSFSFFSFLNVPVVVSYFLYNRRNYCGVSGPTVSFLQRKSTAPSYGAFCPSPKYSLNRQIRNRHHGRSLQNENNIYHPSLLTRHSTMDETGVSDINDDNDDDAIIVEEGEEGMNNRGVAPPMDSFENLDGLSLEELKIRLMEIIGGSTGKNKLLTTSSKRSKVNEILLKLEAMNPTKKPSSSTLLNGVWDFLYTGGISPGLLGLQIALYASEKGNGAISLQDTYLTISRSQPRVEVTAKLNIFGRESTFNIQTNLEPESDVRLFETYVSATLNDAFSIPFPKPGNNKLPDPFRLFERSLFISYLDDDLLIVRDGFGAPDILTRKEMDFGSYTGEPSFSEDDLSPGAG